MGWVWGGNRGGEGWEGEEEQRDGKEGKEEQKWVNKGEEKIYGKRKGKSEKGSSVFSSLKHQKFISQTLCDTVEVFLHLWFSNICIIS